MASAPVPEVRQNFPRDCESGINKQIHMQLQGSYVYLGMVSFVVVCRLGFCAEREVYADDTRAPAVERIAFK